MGMPLLSPTLVVGAELNNGMHTHTACAFGFAPLPSLTCSCPRLLLLVGTQLSCPSVCGSISISTNSSMRSRLPTGKEGRCRLAALLLALLAASLWLDGGGRSAVIAALQPLYFGVRPV